MSEFSSKRSNLVRGISVAAMAVSLAVATPAQAQTFSTIRGENATPGATVTATNANTGERTTVTVNEDGTFVIVGVRPGRYRLEGAIDEPEIVVPVGQTVTVDAAPATAPAEGDIVVSGRRDRTEVRTATVTTNVSPEQIANLPQNDRNFLNFAALAPGVQVSPSGGDKRVQAGAVPGDQINVFIDGLSLKNPINHGGIAGQNFSQGNPFPQLAVQEFKVDTQNFKAEYEQAGSAIITAVTKTGGTEFHGDIFGQFQPKDFVSRKFFDRPGNANNPGFPCPDDATETCYREKSAYERWQYGADLGGPIIPGTLHFFAAYEATDQTLPSTAVDLDANAVPADIVQEFDGSYPQSFKQDLYFGKLTFFATPDDTVDVSYFRRDEENLRDFGGRAVPSHGRLITSNGELFQGEWKHRGPDWLNEMTLAYNTFENGTPRATSGPEILITRGLRDDVAAELGTSPFVQNDRQETWTFKNNATWENGDHVIKAGFKVARTEMSRLEDFRSNGTYYFNGTSNFPGPVYTGFDSSVPWRASVSTVDVVPASVKNTQIGIFIQDDWTPDEHWTINVGLRWDYETNAKNESFVTPANVANALRNYPGWQAAGIDPEDYISTGGNRDPYWKAFQPRLGVSYDVHGDRDLVFFAGAGRYYDRPLFIISGIETIKNYYQSISTIDFCGSPGLPTCDPANRTQIQWNDSYRDLNNLRAAAIAQGLGGDVWLLNNKTKLPYSDQFNLGVRKRFGDWQTSLTLSHIRSHNLFRYVRGNRFSNGWFSRVLQRADVDGDGTVEGNEVVGCTDGGSLWVVDNFPDQDYAACAAMQGDLPGFNGKLNIGNNDGKAKYWAVYLQADKPYTESSGWGVTTTFTWQRARTNVGTELYSDEFFAGPDQTQFGWQYVQGVPKWTFVGTGIVGLPWDFTLSGTLNLTSGPAFGNVIFGLPNAPENACCYANLGGVFYPPQDIAYKTFDVRLAKTFTLPWGGEMTADIQVYNLFDWVNRTYSAWGAGSGAEPTFRENDTVGTGRAFQAGLKYSF